MHPIHVRHEITGTAFARAVGTTYRVVDYWCRTGVLCPSIAMAEGSGTARVYSTEDVALGRVLVELRAHGAETETLRRVVDLLRDVPSARWAGNVLVVPQTGSAFIADPVDALVRLEADAVVSVLIVRLDGVLEPEDVR